VALHNFLAQAQADAGAFVFFSRVQASENIKDAIEVFWRNADAFVRHAEHPLTLGLASAHMHNRGIVAPKLDGVGQQVLQQHGDLAALGVNVG
jgi:hypothetical protein